MSTSSKRHGLQQVADLAGVSLSTVDRVLNERGGVCDLKRRKVLAVSQALGVRRGLPSPVNGQLQIDVWLADSRTDHFRRLDAAFDRLQQTLQPHLKLHRHRWPEHDPQKLLIALRKPRMRRQGLIIIAPDTPPIGETLQAIIRSGTPTVLLTSNFGHLPGAVYVGVDNHAAGRAAGRVMSEWARSREGAVLLLTNSLLYDAHRQRTRGFLEVMAQRAPEVEIIGPLECLDDDAQTFAATAQALDARRIRGIYNSGSGSEGTYRALAASAQHPVWISHEATEQHGRYLREGVMSMVIDQDPEGQVQACLDHLLQVHGVIAMPPRTQQAFRLIIEENLPG